MSRIASFACAVVLSAGAVWAAGPIELPEPVRKGGKPLMEALAQRKSVREFSAEKLSSQMLSNLLWAAFGTNRPDGHRTAPSANNRQEVTVYAATADGLYRYDAAAHRLEPILNEDVRAATGTQPFVAGAPLNLVFVADMATASGTGEDKLLYVAADTGFISQNVYLFCASENLGTVVRASVDRAALAKLMKLPETQRIILAQTVGYPR
jgi:SagB-type dehydrogenase family enzyme